MHSSTLPTLLIIFAITTATPILTDIPKRVRVPAVVLELVLGIVAGSHALNWAKRDEVIDILAEFGLAFLIFLAGFEIDFAALKGKPLKLASTAWACSLALGLVAGFAIAWSGLAISGVVVGLALTSTALGTLLPILRDSGRLATPFGLHVLANGAAAEFGPIIAIAVVLGGKTPGRAMATLFAFAAVGAGAVRLSFRTPPDRLVRLARTTLRTSGQLPVRIAVVMIAALVWWASKLDLDILLGAFVAGVVFRGFSESAHDHEQLHIIESKLDAVGFGFLIPFFFVVSGMKFDLTALTSDAGAIAKLPLFLLLLLVVRGVPIMFLYRSTLSTAGARALALMSSAGLPLIVVITSIGVDTGRMRPGNGAALVGAGMLSVLLFPSIGMSLLSKEPAPQPAAT